MHLTEPSVESVRNQLQKILASPGFVRNDRLSKFLRHIVEQQLEGKAAELKESLVGVEVFGRRPGFDPRQDSVVRTEAARLRARLSKYYAREGVADPVVIELPKGGYSPVFRAAEEAREKPAPLHRLETRSLAVIPLLLRGPEADQYLSVSLADALIHRLSSSGQLIVRPIASVMRYAGEEIEWAKIARELNVDLVVEGVIQVVGRKVRVLVQTHRASDSQTLASIKQDGDMGDLFALQDRLSDAVSEVFVPRDKTAKEKSPASTKHGGAYELYLRAVDRQVHVDKYDMASAIEMLTRATELDPAFADAWGLLAQAYAQMGGHLDPDPKWFDLGEQAIARTLELDPVQCDALCARSIILWSPSRRFQNRAALRALNAALKINPVRQIARHQRSAVLWHLGFLDAALADAEELRLANPALAIPFGHLAYIAMQRGDFQQAIDYTERGLSLEPGQVFLHMNVPQMLLWAGRLAEARQALEKARHLVPNESFLTGVEAIVSALDGNFARAEALADEAAQSVRSLTHTHHTWHYCAGAYALSGKPEKALAELQRCADLGLPNYRLFEMDPSLRSLRTNPAFRGLMTSLRREHDSIREEFGLESEGARS